MGYEKILEQQISREMRPNIRESEISSSVLLEYLEKSLDHKLPYQCICGGIEDLLYNYFLIKGTANEKIMTEILESHGFNYTMSVHNAIYYMLGKEEELFGMDVNPLSWPGVKKINHTNDCYTVETNIGTINVAKASVLFSGTMSAHIFQKPLMGECYARSYDFLKENRDYHAVLSYMPNFFYGGHYHAYLEKDSKILDIASNAFYESKESADKVLNGEIIAKLSYEEVEHQFKKVKKLIPEIKHYSKLHVLTLCYDAKML